MMRRVSLYLAAAGLSLGSNIFASALPPEKVLPTNTLVVLTSPDFVKARELLAKTPQAQLWNDAAMKPFHDYFLRRWREEFTGPLERSLNLNLNAWLNLAQGQVTLALIPCEGAGPGLVLMADSMDKRAQLKKNLAELRRKWFDSGKELHSVKIREIEFTVLSLGENDLPESLNRVLPRGLEAPASGAEAKPKSAPARQLVVGQVDSVLVLGNSLKVVEPVVVRMTGGTASCLDEQAGYQAARQALFQAAPAYGWIDAAALLKAWGRKPLEKPVPGAAGSVEVPTVEKLFAAAGLSAVKSVSFSLQRSNEGVLMQIFLAVPESSRQGLLSILAGEPRETIPPPFVPAGLGKFRRWRADGQKTWATFLKMVGDISPQGIGTINFILDTANDNARLKDPAFDIRKSLIGNLGDDFITYETPPTNSSGGPGGSPASLLLLGSPNPDQLAVAVKNILVFVTQSAEAPAEREFLGRKIFSVQVPPTPLTSEAMTLNYAAAGGYVAFSTDAALLEEYLRSGEAQFKRLREMPGLAEASQQVVGPGTSLFGYESQVESARIKFEEHRSGANPATNTPPALASLPGVAGIALPAKGLRDLMDFSLLPPFDAVSRYFYFTVYGGSASVDGLTLKLFAPTPPPLKPQ